MFRAELIALAVGVLHRRTARGGVSSVGDGVYFADPESSGPDGSVGAL